MVRLDELEFAGPKCTAKTDVLLIELYCQIQVLIR
jgi:hypothetical protein